MATIPPSSLPHPTLTCPEPAWEVALLFPSQGSWSDGDYLALDTNRLVELVDGNLEVLPMPSMMHQLIVAYLHCLLKDFVRQRGLGQVFFAPLPVRIRQRAFREPDVLFISREHLGKADDKYVEGAALVMEVVSPDEGSHERDYQEKRTDYAARKIPEYWIVDPQTERIIVLILDGQQYRVHGEFTLNEHATSVLLDGFSADVRAVFAAGRNLS